MSFLSEKEILKTLRGSFNNINRSSGGMAGISSILKHSSNHLYEETININGFKEMFQLDPLFSKIWTKIVAGN